MDFLKPDVEVALTFADLYQTEKAHDPDASKRLREKVQRAYEKFLPRVPADNTEGRKQIEGRREPLREENHGATHSWTSSGSSLPAASALLNDRMLRRDKTSHFAVDRQIGLAIFVFKPSWLSGRGLWNKYAEDRQARTLATFVLSDGHAACRGRAIWRLWGAAPRCAGRTAAQSAVGGLSGSTEETTTGALARQLIWRTMALFHYRSQS